MLSAPSGVRGVALRHKVAAGSGPKATHTTKIGRVARSIRRPAQPCMRRNDTACLKSLPVPCCVIRGYQCCRPTPHEDCDDLAQLRSVVLWQMISLC